MRGYKIFGADYTCREYKYSLDTTNIYDGKIEMCFSGFHFCPIAVGCLLYYSCDPENTYAEVECGDEYIVEDDKVVCKELRIVKTLTFEEFRELATGTIKTKNPTLECSYVSGVLHGSYKRWHKNGQLEIETTYVNGKQNGICKQWYDNRQLYTQCNYVDGLLHGVYKEWYNGKLRFEINYTNGCA